MVARSSGWPNRNTTYFTANSGSGMNYGFFFNFFKNFLKTWISVIFCKKMLRQLFRRHSSKFFETSPAVSDFYFWWQLLLSNINNWKNKKSKTLWNIILVWKVLFYFLKKCPNVNCVVDLSVIALVSISKKKTNLKKCPKPQRSLANCVVNGVVFL